MNSTGSVFVVLQLPQPWPLTSDIVLLSYIVKSTAVNLIARSDGSLALALDPKDSPRRLHESQRLQFTGSGKVLIDFSWTDNEVSLSINNHDLLLGDPARLPVLTLHTKGEVEPHSTLVFPGIDRRAARSEAEALFLGTIINLDQTILESDWYTSLRAAGSLRQLLLEGLIHRANEHHGVGLIFRINEFDSEPPVADYQFHWIGLDPSHVPTARTICLDLDGFLAAKCLVFKGGVATVKDIIRACANAKGGVHLGKPRPGGETVVISFDEITNFLGLPASLNAVLDLCRITLEAAKPLVHSINIRT